METQSSYLYSFSKNSWHVRFYKWLFYVDPTKKFKSMCPYFWTYVLIFIFLPFILLIKSLGTYGAKLLKYLEDYQSNRKEKNKEKFIEKANLIKTEEEAYFFVKNKCFEKFSWALEYDLYYNLIKMKNNYRDNIIQKKEKQIIKRNEYFNKQIQEVKENKYLTYFFMVLSVGMFFMVLYSLVSVFHHLIVNVICWNTVFEILKIILFGILIGSAIILFSYLITISFRFIYLKLSCCNISFNWLNPFIKIFSKPFIFIAKGFSFIWTFFLIVIDMFYNLYKKNCPIIEWKE